MPVTITTQDMREIIETRQPDCFVQPGIRLILTDETDINSQKLISADYFSQSEKINPF